MSRSIFTSASNLMQCTPLARDGQFFLALAAAPLILLLMTWLWPAWSAGIRPDVRLALSMVLWQPLLEELLFRGAIQGRLAALGWARHRLAGLSISNWLATILFALAHLVYHAPLWATSVILPSLVFGYFRERYDRVYPAILLHAIYNGSYLAIGALSNTT
ncbi:MAG TPA: JDVT-CTERM system glutamic-type intramembrane protease [Noviherbaspirillum sp.]|nr:JDVT-CTERM system glutamic-type intramembrane protease [Noviherbaspirillum sp.]